MLSDTEARALLHQAAATVEVDPAGPLALPPHRPWWPAVAAAAAVAVTVTGLAVGLGGDDPAPEPAPPTTGDTTFRLGPDQVPSVFGYDGDDAALMLHEAGYAVVVETVPGGCNDEGRAVGTEPSVGTIVEPGSTVTVLESLGESGLCQLDPAGAVAWELLNLAGGRTSSLTLAPEVTAYDGDAATTLSADELTTWAPLVDVVERMSMPVRVNGEFQMPHLGASRRAACRQDLALTTVPALWVTAEVPSDGVGLGCRAVVLFREAGVVTAVQVVDTYAETPAPELPDVVGNSAAYATERLTAQGYDVAEVHRPDCGQPGQVTAQERVGDTVHLAVTSRPTRLCSEGPLGSELTVPSVLGLTGVQATARLAGLGLEVEVRVQDGCESPGRTDGTSPAAGRNVPLGSDITVWVDGDRPRVACPPGDATARVAAWELLDFLDGRGSAPALSPALRIVVDGRPSGWEPLAAAVATELRWHLEPGLEQLGDPTRHLVARTVTTSAPRGGCEPAVPPELRGRPATDIVLDWNTIGFYVACPVRILVIRDDQGAVEAVVATTDPDGRTG